MNVSGMKTYRNKTGYEIQATEKAYHLFYERQGFKPVDNKKKETEGATGETELEETEGATGETELEETEGATGETELEETEGATVETEPEETEGDTGKETTEETGDKPVAKVRKTSKKKE